MLKYKGQRIKTFELSFESAYCPSRPNHSIKTKTIINRIKFLGRTSGIVKSELENISEM